MNAYSFFRRGLNAMLALSSPVSLAEHLLEVKERAVLTRDDSFMAIGGRKVRYRLCGKGEGTANGGGPTVVFVNGLMGSLEQWELVQEGLAGHVPVLAYDRGGMGFSDATIWNRAEAQADELRELLHGLGLTPPFVLVSYSASALLVRLFAERQPGLVAGLVFLDPVLPAYGYIAPRIFALCLVQSFFGVLRVKDAIAHRRSPPRSLSHRKERAMIVSSHHWVAVASDGIRLGNWTPRLMGLPTFGDLPVGVLCTFDEQNPEHRPAVDASRALAAESSRGTFMFARAEGGKSIGHSSLVNEAPGAAVVTDFIGRMLREVRENPSSEEPHHRVASSRGAS